MKVSDVMLREFGTVEPDATLQIAAQRMADLDTDTLSVGDAQELQGIVTSRDIILRAVAQGLDPRRTRVAEVMTRQLLTCRPDDELDDVADQMTRHHVRRMPVVDTDGSLVGLISRRDLPPKRT